MNTEEYEINLDYVTIPALEELDEKERFVVYFQYDYIFKLRNLQVFLNSKLYDESQSCEFLDYLKSFMNLKELDLMLCPVYKRQ